MAGLYKTSCKSYGRSSSITGHFRQDQALTECSAGLSYMAAEPTGHGTSSHRDMALGGLDQQGWANDVLMSGGGLLLSQGKVDSAGRAKPAFEAIQSWDVKGLRWLHIRLCCTSGVEGVAGKLSKGGSQGKR